MEKKLKSATTEELLGELRTRKEFEETDLYIASLSIKQLWKEFSGRFSCVTYVGRTQKQTNAIPIVEFEWDIEGDALQAVAMLTHVSEFVRDEMMMSERLGIAKEHLRGVFESPDEDDEDDEDDEEGLNESP